MRTKSLHILGSAQDMRGEQGSASVLTSPTNDLDAAKLIGGIVAHETQLTEYATKFRLVCSPSCASSPSDPPPLRGGRKGRFRFTPYAPLVLTRRWRANENAFCMNGLARTSLIT
jgi:hypothetical protein